MDTDKPLTRNELLHLLQGGNHDLSGRNLKGIDLSPILGQDVYDPDAGASFFYTPSTPLDLRGVNFEETDLSHANLSEANLHSANLSGANLQGTLQLHLFGGSLPEGAFGEELFSL